MFTQTIKSIRLESGMNERLKLFGSNVRKASSIHRKNRNGKCNDKIDYIAHSNELVG